MEEAIKDAKEALKSDNVDDMNKAVEKITQASHGLAQKMYEEAAKKKAEQGGAGSQSKPAEGEEPSGKDQGKDDVVDADYEVMDDDKDSTK